MAQLTFEWDRAKSVSNELYMRNSGMRKHYDFSDSKPNPYAQRLKKQITIRIDEPTVEYFKELAEELGLPYQSLINLYLRDCASEKRKLSLNWA